jgi:hypothetical protein
LIIFFPSTQDIVLAYIGRSRKTNAIIIITTVLILATLLGFFGMELPQFFFYIGYILLICHLYLLLTSYKNKRTIIYFAFTALLSLWVIGVCWSKQTLNPTFLESAAAGILGWAGWNGTDTLYHIALSQMLKTYHIPSTGIDGLPFTYYHFGSHFIFANLSSLIDVPVLELYNMGYPILIIPVFFQLTFLAIKGIKDVVSHSNSSPIGLISFFVFIFYFLQLVRHHYAGGGLGTTFLVSESSTFSLIFFIYSASLVLTYWKLKENSFVGTFLLFLVIPVSIIMLGFMKISTFYIFEGILTYLFIRMKAYLKIRNICFLLLNFCSVAFVLFYSLETLPWGLRSHLKPSLDSTGLDPFSFFQMEFKPLDFALMYYQVTLLILAFLLCSKIKSFKLLSKSFHRKETLGVEVVVVSIIMGLIPVMLLKLYLPNYMYFLFVQSFLSILFIPAYLKENFFQIKNPSIRWKVVGISSLVLVVVFSFFFISIQKDLNGIVNINLRTRTELAHDKSIAWTKIDFLKSVKLLRQVQSKQLIVDSITGNPILRILTKLKELDSLPLREKNESLIYADLSEIPMKARNPTTTLFWVDFSKVNPNWMLFCYDLPMIIPALSGIAMIDGMPCNCPNLIGHGYIFYADKADCKPIESMEELKKKIKVSGIKQIFVFNKTTYVFEKILIN